VTREPVRASQVSRAPVTWLWQQRIPRGMISVVAGAPGFGKTMFAYLVAAHTSRGGESVLLSSPEESRRVTARPRLEAAGAQLELVHFWTPELPEDLGRLRDQIIDCDAGLLILDPIAAHLSVSMRDEQKVRRALTPLSELAEETGAAILLISHTIKTIPKNALPMYAIGGPSGGLLAVSRAAYLFGAGDGDERERRLASVKPNLLPLDVPSFVFDVDVIDDVPFLVEVGEDGHSLEDARLMVRHAVGSDLAPEKISAARAWLTEFLTDGPQKGEYIRTCAKSDGHSVRTLRRAADQLGVIRGRGPGAPWQLPDGLTEAFSEGDDA
jgi:hypothetical protein